MEVKVINKSKNKLPEYATVGSAGCDLMADFSDLDKIILNRIICFNSYITWEKDNTIKSLKEVEFFLGNWKKALKGIRLFKILK